MPLDRITENKRNQFITNLEQRMASAGSQMAGFNQSVADVHANLLGYYGTSPDPDEITATIASLAGVVQSFVDNHKTGLAASLDTIAGSLGKTRQQLLDELAAV